MNIEVNQINGCKREMTVQVPPETLLGDYNAVCERYRLMAKVPGFRPGRAPMQVILKRHKAAIREDFVEKAVEKHLLEAMRERGLSPLSSPKIQNLSYEEGAPLQFTAVFEVLPKLEIASYRGLEIEKVIPEVNNGEIEESVRQIQERQAEYLPVEGRPIQSGDTAIVSYTGKYLDNSRPAFNGDDIYCEVGAEKTLKEFTDNLLGVAPSDQRRFLVSYPKDFPNHSMASKEVEYLLTVKAIKLKKLPELNDDFAKNVGSYNSMGELESKLREDMIASKQEAARTDMQEKLIDLVLEQNSFDVPEVMVQRQTEARLNDFVQTLLMQGIHPQTANLDWTKLQQQQKERAEHDVRVSLLLDYVAEEEKIEVSEAEVDSEILKRAQAAKQSFEAVKSRLTKEGGTDRIKTRIRNRKSLDLLLSLASFKNPQGIIIQP